jgi:hypothetical protein
MGGTEGTDAARRLRRSKKTARQSRVRTQTAHAHARRFERRPGCPISVCPLSLLSLSLRALCFCFVAASVRLNGQRCRRQAPLPPSQGAERGAHPSPVSAWPLRIPSIRFRFGSGKTAQLNCTGPLLSPPSPLRGQRTGEGPRPEEPASRLRGTPAGHTTQA